LPFTGQIAKNGTAPGEDNGVGELIGIVSAAEECHGTPHFVITVTTVWDQRLRRFHQNAARAMKMTPEKMLSAGRPITNGLTFGRR